MNVIHKLGMVIIHNRATITTAIGVIGLCGAGVLACRSTYKDGGETVKKMRDDLEVIDENPALDETTIVKAKRNVYIEAVKTTCKNYAPAVGVAALSIGMIMYGHNTLRKEYFMAAGAYKALTSDFDHYRNKVKAFVGDGMERNISTMKRPPKIVEVENAETNEIEQIEEVDLEDIPTNRSVFFDETCQPWVERGGDPELIKTFLMELEEEFTKKLNDPKGKGYVLLNEIYKELDVKETYAGANCGWVRGLGDDHIDFGIFNLNSQASRRFVNGLENVILLTFNDEGYILDKI